MAKENKGADQLRSYCAAGLRLCFRISIIPVSHDAAQFLLPKGAMYANFLCSLCFFTIFFNFLLYCYYDFKAAISRGSFIFQKKKIQMLFAANIGNVYFQNIHYM